MNYIKSLTHRLIITFVFTIPFAISLSAQSIEQNGFKAPPSEVNKIKVLNFGTFHMGFTPDENTTEFNEHDKENQKKVHVIAKMLSEFKPTVIVIETTPESNEQIQEEYKSYIAKPDMFFKHPSEIELLAYELGRLSGTERIYGIDHRMGYNYRIAREIENTIDSNMVKNYYANPFKYHTSLEVDEEKLNLIDKLKLTNSNQYLDFLITINADILTHAATNGNFEGADEATRYYQRNLRMYSNLNRLNLDENDRVFILMGASHTAFFRDFIHRSPRYEMVNTFDYLD